MITAKIHAVGFHYETYGEISPSGTLSLKLLYATLLSLILPIQIEMCTRIFGEAG